MTRKRSGILGLLFLIVVGLAVAGLFVAQQRYIRYHLPLIQAQLTNAEAKGGEMLERIGVPAGSQSSHRSTGQSVAAVPPAEECGATRRVL